MSLMSAADSCLFIFFTIFFLCVFFLLKKINSAALSGGSRVVLRNLLRGLGTAAAARLSITDRKPSGLPIKAPHPSKCGDVPSDHPPPRYPSIIIDFEPPPPTEPLRIRRPAHLADPEYLAKYEKAVKLMKALPADDPRNFTRQSHLHWAYCEDFYELIGFPDLDLKIHRSWFFFPWHRCFLYFHERILGKLIGDETFALPFWNWDAPEAMKMLEMYTDSSSSLYNVLRDAKHQPPTPVDLDYDGRDYPISKDQQIKENLTTMYREVISHGKNAELFMGAPYRPGDKPSPGPGSLENIPHNTVHTWAGDRNQPNCENMGAFYSAARDPMFFAHHSNIDRMWNVWKTLGGKHKDFQDDDWLNAAFVLYDENAQLVRVKVKDCLDTEKLRYTYQDVENPWLKSRPTPAAKKALFFKSNKSSITGGATFPVILESAVTKTVKRPKVSPRSKEEKEEEEEVLVVDEIEFEGDSFIKFDVYINMPEYQGVGPESSEFAGSFVNVPHKPKHKHGMKMTMKTKLKLGITDLLEDLEAEGDESVLVTLVLRSGKKVKIGGIKIEFSK